MTLGYHLQFCCWIDLLACHRMAASDDIRIFPERNVFWQVVLVFPSSPFSHLLPISSRPPECLLISLISSNCTPSSTTLRIQEDHLPSRTTGAHCPSRPFSPSSPCTWLTAPHRCGPRWSHHHEWWAPRHLTSPSITSSNLHSPKTSTLTPISEGPRHPLYKVTWLTITQMLFSFNCSVSLDPPQHSVLLKLWSFNLNQQFCYLCITKVILFNKPNSLDHIHNLSQPNWIYTTWWTIQRHNVREG